MKYPNIEKERTLAGKTQTGLCAELGIPYSNYKSWQSGRHEMSVKDAVKFADVFNCSLDYLIGRSDKDE